MNKLTFVAVCLALSFGISFAMITPSVMGQPTYMNQSGINMSASRDRLKTPFLVTTPRFLKTIPVLAILTTPYLTAWKQTKIKVIRKLE